MTTKINRNFEKSIPFIIHKMHWAIHQAVNRVFAQSGIDITMDQFLLVVYLWNNDGTSQQELATRTGKDKAGIARLLDQLSKRGLIKRAPDKNDRRIKRVIVTERGRTVHQSCHVQGNQNRRDAEKGISQKDLEITRLTLVKMLKNIQNKNDKPE